jgi:hypothetical protein
LTGVPSLELVRLLNRMIKERKFNVHPEVLSCLTYLRLKTELGVRASESKVDRPETKAVPKGKAAARRAKGKATDQPHLSKKAQKALKEKKAIQKEMHEAAAEVDKEERAANVGFSWWSSMISGYRALVMMLIVCSLFFLANRNAKAAVCPLLSHPEEPSADTAPSGRSTRHLAVLTLGQH